MKKTKYEFGDCGLSSVKGLKKILWRGARRSLLMRSTGWLRFRQQTVMTKAAGPNRFHQQDLGISILLDMQWESDDSAVVYVQQVNLDNPQPAAVCE